jgi:hypothetical protein
MEYTKEAIRLLYLYDNPRTILAEYQKYKNTLILDGLFGVALFKDIILDDPEDHYYVLRGSKVSEYKASCVGRLIFLKDSLKKEDYDELVRVWNLNYVIEHGRAV